MKYDTTTKKVMDTYSKLSKRHTKICIVYQHNLNLLLELARTREIITSQLQYNSTIKLNTFQIAYWQKIILQQKKMIITE